MSNEETFSVTLPLSEKDHRTALEEPLPGELGIRSRVDESYRRRKLSCGCPKVVWQWIDAVA